MLTHRFHTGECKHLIAGYLKCIKSQRGLNDEECRKLAKGYLACRMDKYVRSCFSASVEGSLIGTNLCLFGRNLMAPDDFKNLGLIFENEGKNANEKS
jgi:cytochrome c oxidase assembly protein subunit 19